jgi:hypothetical protein
MPRGHGQGVVPQAAPEAGTDAIGVQAQVDQLDVVGLDAQAVEPDQAVAILENEHRRPRDVLRRGQPFGAQ